jgi:hypothetical protein
VSVTSHTFASEGCVVRRLEVPPARVLRSACSFPFNTFPIVQHVFLFACHPLADWRWRGSSILAPFSGPWTNIPCNPARLRSRAAATVRKMKLVHVFNLELLFDSGDL